MKETEKLRAFTIQNLRMFAKIIKPWTIRSVENGGRESVEYAKGWNDCVKEVTHFTKKAITHIEEKTIKFL